MAEYNRGLVTMQFRDGSQLYDWTTFSLRDSYTDPLGSFEFQARPVRSKIPEYLAKLQKGSLVAIQINGNPQATMLIQSRQTRVSKSEGVVIDVEAKTVLVTAYEGHVDPNIAESFQSDTPVSEVVLKALRPFGFETIETDTSANVAAITGRPLDGRKASVFIQQLKHKDAKANEGETGYGFASRIFTRLGLALRSDVFGKLLLGSPDYEQAPGFELEQSTKQGRSSDGFIGTVTISETNDGVFTEYVVRGVAQDKRGQKRAAQPAHRLRVEGTPDPGPDVPFAKLRTTTIPEGLHTYRSDSGAVFKPFYRLDKFARDQSRCEVMCKRAHGRKSEAAFTVEGEVDGLVSSSGRIWAVDTVARVRIEQIDLDAPMWISEVTKVADRNGGQRTRLKLVPLNSLILGID